MLRKIFGEVRLGDHYHIRTKQKLYALFNDMDVSKRINVLRYRWLGYVFRMEVDAPPRRVFVAVVGDQRPG